ncbi:MAG: DUF167 domain-containing protein [Austwickia sp.]|nr:DUF167 domain-containing protein [Austwickia sp.]MBK8435600.1 DUF167 domain-containing protein [Austwickia sp.]MBK9100830.1 DUF167 domain-containing protein [Austwickia sp.]
MNITVRVRPGASRTRVGGRYEPGSGPVQLGVAVTARAVDGAANRAVIAAVAEAFCVRPREVELVSGATARSKVLRIGGDDSDLADRLRELLG